MLSNVTPASTPVTPADMAIAQGLNQALATVSTALNGNSNAVGSVLNAIATAIANINGGSTGATDQVILRSKGTSGHGLQSSIATLDNSGNIGSVGNITQNGGGNNAAVPRVLVQSSAAQQLRYWQTNTNSSARWQVGTENVPESGQNAGSNFFINNFDDTGAYISTPIFIPRSTGVVTTNSLSAGSIATNTLTVGGGTAPWAIAAPVQFVFSSGTITIPANATKCKITLIGGGGGGAGVAGISGGGSGGGICGSGGACTSCGATGGCGGVGGGSCSGGCGGGSC